MSKLNIEPGDVLECIVQEGPTPFYQFVVGRLSKETLCVSIEVVSGDDIIRVYIGFITKINKRGFTYRTSLFTGRFINCFCSWSDWQLIKMPWE